MQSTPAVFLTPAVSKGGVYTPTVFKQESFPWAVKTPEASPMCWGITPDVTSSGYSQGVPSSQPPISRELLRAVCEPFFDQMLTALQQALQTTQRQQCDANRQVMHMTQELTKPASFQPDFNAQMHQWTYLDPTLDEESTEADDVGAFASLLTGSSSEQESINGTEAQSPEAEFSQPLMPNQDLPQESEQASDSEKSVMVCRHWKTKGWCRLEANCKFLHPEHKRGIAAPKGCSAGSINDGDINKAACPGMSTTFGLPEDAPLATVLPRHRKRGGRNRSSKVNQAELQRLHKETTVAVLPERMGEASFFYFQCAPFV